MTGLLVLHVIAVAGLGLVSFAVGEPIMGLLILAAAGGLATFYVRLGIDPTESSGLLRGVVRDVIDTSYYNRERTADSAGMWGATAIFVVAAVAGGQLWAPLTFAFSGVAITMHAFLWRGSYHYVRYELQLDERIKRSPLLEQAHA